jgi:protein arginine kinase activator
MPMSLFDPSCGARPTVVMHCDHCDKPAVVHEVVVTKDGATVEVHLCEQHAAERGYPMPAGSLGAGHPPVHQMLTSVVVGSAGPRPAAKVGVKSCPNCGRTIAQIRDTGLLGCTDCYATFEGSLEPLIERAQAGSNFHVGRAPRGALDASARHALRSRLVRELDEAVVAEQYERAARLRDRIRNLHDEVGADTQADAPGETAR